MALDELKDSDNSYEVEGYTYIVDKDFMEKAKPIKVDFTGMGFNITSNIKLESGSACSSCSTDSGCS